MSVAPLMFVNDPVAVAPRAHRQDSLVTPSSGSVTDAASVDPPDSGVPVIVTTPGSFRLLDGDGHGDGVIDRGGVCATGGVLAVVHVHGHAVAALHLVVQRGTGLQPAVACHDAEGRGVRAGQRVGQRVAVRVVGRHRSPEDHPGRELFSDTVRVAVVLLNAGAALVPATVFVEMALAVLSTVVL